jgi:hypothetical protein
MNAQNAKSTTVKQNKNATKRTPRYKFDETWIESINRCIRNGHDYNDRSHAYSADDITNLIRQYIEGTNDCTGLYDSSFGCAWVVIKAEIDRRKARNARARERRQQRRAEKLTSANVAEESSEPTPENMNEILVSDEVLVCDKTLVSDNSVSPSSEPVAETACQAAPEANIIIQNISEANIEALAPTEIWPHCEPTAPCRGKDANASKLVRKLLKNSRHPNKKRSKCRW